MNLSHAYLGEIFAFFIIDKDPDQLKIPFVLWTRKAVKELIANRYGMDMPIKTVGVKMKKTKAMPSFHMGARVIYFTNQEPHCCWADRFWQKFR